MICGLLKMGAGKQLLPPETTLRFKQTKQTDFISGYRKYELFGIACVFVFILHKPTWFTLFYQILLNIFKIFSSIYMAQSLNHYHPHHTNQKICCHLTHLRKPDQF